MTQIGFIMGLLAAPSLVVYVKGGNANWAGHLASPLFSDSLRLDTSSGRAPWHKCFRHPSRDGMI